MIYFAGDAHVCSQRRLQDDLSPYTNAEKYTRDVIDNINQVCGVDDTLVLTGDWIDCSREDHTHWHSGIEYLKELHTNIVYICGNNEDRVLRDDVGFDEFRDMLVENGVRNVVKTGIVVSTKYGDWWATHKPSACRADMFNVFAHVHIMGPITGLGFNSTIPLNHYRPWSEDDIQLARSWVVELWDDVDWRLAIGGTINEHWRDGVTIKET